MDHKDDEDVEDESDDTEDLKRRRVKGKMDRFLADVADDMVDEKVLKKTRAIMERHLRDIGVPATWLYLKALQIGFDMGVSASHQLGPEVATMFAAMQKVLKDKKDEGDKRIPHGK